MAISKTRKHFRRALYALMLASFLFAGTMSVLYVGVRTDYIQIKDISPALFHADVTQSQVRAAFMTQEEKFTLASDLRRRGIFSGIYYQAGQKMIFDLSDANYAPAQTVKANILLNTSRTRADQKEALSLYRAAAAQNYEPAILKLALLERGNIE